jgi:hypothetical protein
MASIYSNDGHTITEGLQNSSVCDEAIIAARNIASDRGEPVIIEDDGEEWIVKPNGKKSYLGKSSQENNEDPAYWDRINNEI